MITRKHKFQSHVSVELTSFRKRYEKHPLHIQSTVREGMEKFDPKTKVWLQAEIQTFACMGIGVNRGIGLKVKEMQQADKIIAISDLPLQLMDLLNYSVWDYENNNYYIFGDYAIHRNDFTMLGNTRAPLDQYGNIEKFNCNLICRSLPSKSGLKECNEPGKYIYIRTLRKMEAGEFVLFEKYGGGRHSISWGQKPTLKRQVLNVGQYVAAKMEIKNSSQKGNKICDECGMKLPRGANNVQVHNIKCPKLKK